MTIELVMPGDPTPDGLIPTEELEVDPDISKEEALKILEQIFADSSNSGGFRPLLIAGLGFFGGSRFAYTDEAGNTEKYLVTETNEEVSMFKAKRIDPGSDEAERWTGYEDLWYAWIQGRVQRTPSTDRADGGLSETTDFEQAVETYRENPVACTCHHEPMEWVLEVDFLDREDTMRFIKCDEQLGEMEAADNLEIVRKEHVPHE